MSLVQEVIAELQYSESPNFLRPGPKNSFEEAADFGHIFRRAREKCQLQGVYALRETAQNGAESITPVVYVCEARNDADAHEIHRLVWNQNVVPFVIVVTPKEIRLYSGFRYESPDTGLDAVTSGFLGAAENISNALSFLEAFQAPNINNGEIWERWGGQVTPATRVDWKLLSSLNDLDAWLRSNGIKDARTSHALIGKYVYLQYLSHRGILSDRKLAKWGLEHRQVFGRTAQASAFWKVVDELDSWLNGSVFPISFDKQSRPRAEHIRKVAGTFAGDDPASGQLSLGFEVYDFSFIPIETLSVIYEQFLHSPQPNGDSKGKSQGAYYTPVTLVNFILEELDALHPFKPGMRVLDPACGSGAFLVQCYRRIIERDEEFTPGEPMRPARLRDLLERHIFGIDRDYDACRVTELSLNLTLLDYVNPPDLEQTPTFRLPELHGQNIFHGDFFDAEADWHDTVLPESFDWIVGNPPWIELKGSNDSEEERHVRNWLQSKENQRVYPTGGNQVAEAFTWEVMQYCREEGLIGLLLPAMTLFKSESQRFRQAFFSQVNLFSVANFANLRRVLFPGHRYRSGKRTTAKRPVRPAAALFYSPASESKARPNTLAYSPFVVEQTANRPNQQGVRQDTWNITIDSTQVRELAASELKDGDALIWKTAMWGSHLDFRLLSSLKQRFDSLQVFLSNNDLHISQGFELRTKSDREETEPLPDLVEKPLLNMDALRNCGRIFEFPDTALVPIEKEKANLRLRGGRAGLTVSYPPHVIVDGARRFAVYSDEFIAVPPRQIGISGNESHAKLLKALSLFLYSDFARYYQFFASPEWGISTPLSTLDTLKSLPIPFAKLGEKDLNAWARLHDSIVATAREVEEEFIGKILFDNSLMSKKLAQYIRKLNDEVFRLLELRSDERILIEDLVHLRMQLFEGTAPKEITRQPTLEELLDYARTLIDELNEFVGDDSGIRHSAALLRNGKSCMLSVNLCRKFSKGSEAITVVKSDSKIASQFAEIRKKSELLYSQWHYFRRNLRLYEGDTTYLFKPLERLHWTKSQALLDAGSIIAETLT